MSGDTGLIPDLDLIEASAIAAGDMAELADVSEPDPSPGGDARHTTKRYSPVDLINEVKPDAPSDNQSYGRANGAWKRVEDWLGTPAQDGWVLSSTAAGARSWVAQTGGGGTPGGSPTHVQFNDSGSFGGSDNFTWDNANRRLYSFAETLLTETTIDRPVLRLQTADGSSANPLLQLEDNAANPVVTINAFGTTVFNEQGSAAPWRVESAGNENMLFVDGALNRVGVGTGSPESPFTVNSSISNAARFKVVDTATSFGLAGTAFSLQNTHLATNTFANFDFKDSAGSTVAGIYCQILSQTNHYGEISFVTNSSGGFRQMCYVNGAGVGILKKPSSPLDIAFPTNNCRFVDANNSTGTEAAVISVNIDGTVGYLRVYATP